MKSKLLLNAITTGLLTCFAQTPIFAALAPNTAISNDGTIESITEPRGGKGGGVNSQPPSLAKGEAFDAQAEYPAFVMTPSEMQDFAKNYKPAVPGYAKNRAVAESVIGMDARYRIYPLASEPERAIGQITFTRGGNNFICTGWLIGHNTVATAGHCVHSGGSGGVWHSDVKFYPARDGANNPYGFCTAKSLHSVLGWVNSGSQNFDYGAIKLNCSIGNSTGKFGFFWAAASLVGLPSQVSGYPGDKPAGTHWSTSGDIAVSEAQKTRYKHDSFGGQSGGPVFQTDRLGPFCVGACVNTIHAYGAFNGNNSGTRINETVYNHLIHWRNLP
jgi:glutamyl endopeptidase